MPRSDKEIVELAGKVYEALASVDWNKKDLTDFGHCFYARAPLSKMSPSARKTLYQAMFKLDTIFPLPMPEAAIPPPAPVAAVNVTPTKVEIAVPPGVPMVSVTPTAAPEIQDAVIIPNATNGTQEKTQ